MPRVGVESEGDGDGDGGGDGLGDFIVDRDEVMGSGGVEDGGMDEMEGCVGGGEAAEERGISGWGGMRL